jgi:pyridoxal phosphate enzyme (YggS family)
MSGAGDRLESVRRRIAAAARRAGRQPGRVRLVAVSKTRSVADIQTLIDLGVRDFGENQVQEAVPKIEHFRDAALDWHFIGHVQSNKTRHLARGFRWIHAVDSVRLARRLAQAVPPGGECPGLLLQVNVAGDPAKHGLQPRELYPAVEALLAQQPGIQPRGLMTIGFLGADSGQARASFAALRELLEGCRQRFGDSFRELSMGMSGDFELAIEEGATMVRVGTAVFGDRP